MNTILSLTGTGWLLALGPNGQQRVLGRCETLLKPANSAAAAPPVAEVFARLCAEHCPTQDPLVLVVPRPLAPELAAALRAALAGRRLLLAHRADLARATAPPSDAAGPARWFVDADEAGLLFHRLDQPQQDPIRVAVDLRDAARQQRNAILAAFRDQVDLALIGATDEVLGRWIENTVRANEAVWEGRPDPHGRRHSYRLAPEVFAAALRHEKTQALLLAATPSAPARQEDDLLVADWLDRRFALAEMLGRPGGPRVSRFAADKEFESAQTWVSRQPLAAPAPPHPMQSEGSTIEPIRPRRRLAAVAALLVVALAGLAAGLAMPWRLVSRNVPGLAGSAASEEIQELRAQLVEVRNVLTNLTQRLTAAQQTASTTSNALAQLKASVENDRRTNASNLSSVEQRLKSSLETEMQAALTRLTKLEQQAGTRPDLPRVFDTLSAKEIKVVDAAGEPRAILGTDSDGGLVRILDSQKRTVVILSATKSGGQVSINDNQSRGAVLAAVLPNGNPVISVQNTLRKTPVVTLGCTDYDGDGYLTVSDRLGQSVVFAGVATSNGVVFLNNAAGKTLAIIGASGESGFVTLENAAGKQLVALSSTSGGRGGLFLNDAQGREMAKIGAGESSGFVILQNAAGKELVSLSSTTGGHGGLFLKDAQGREMAKIGAGESSGFVTLQNAAGKQLVALSSSEDGEGIVDLSDRRGNRWFRASGEERAIWFADYAGSSQGTSWRPAKPSSSSR
jgi:hypothetical protein